jgi:hypothetical protein
MYGMNNGDRQFSAARAQCKKRLPVLRDNQQCGAESEGLYIVNRHVKAGAGE